MKVAVVVANLNMGTTLGRALRSARLQTVPVAEIIVVDGGSTDNSMQVARDFEAGWMVERVGKQGRARNLGICATDAECIVPLDADDWIEPIYVEDCLEKMTPGVGIVATQMVWPGGEIEVPLPPFTVEHFLESNLIFSCSMFRRAAWREAGGYEEDPRIWEDWDLWLRIVERGWRVAVVDQPLFHFGHRAHGERPEHLTPELEEEWTANVRRKHAERMCLT